MRTVTPDYPHHTNEDRVLGALLHEYITKHTVAGELAPQDLDMDEWYPTIGGAMLDVLRKQGLLGGFDAIR